MSVSSLIRLVRIFETQLVVFFDLYFQGEGAKDLARQELHDAANQFIKRIKQVEKVVNKMLDEEQI